MVDPNSNGMNGCMRCPDCKLVPMPTLTQDTQGHDIWELRCAPHGHVALGEDIDQVVKHWNIYVWFKLTGEVLQ